MTTASDQTLAPPAQPAWQRAAWAFVALALTVGVITGYRRAWRNRPDWQPLRDEVRYVWQHGRTAPGTAMFGYLPTTTFALFPFMAWSPVPIGAALYIATNLAAALVSIRLVRRWWLGSADATFVVPVALAAVNFAHAIQANQLTLWTLALGAAGLALCERQRPLVGGLLLGLAALLKTLPALLCLYVLLRRRWKALPGMLAAFILFDAIPSVACFGVRGAVEEHAAWLRRAAWHSSYLQIEDPLLWARRHRSNFSYAAVLGRWLRGVPPADTQLVFYGQVPPEELAAARANLQPGEVLSHDPMPPHDGGWTQRRVDVRWVPRWHLAELPSGVVYGLWLGSLALGFGLLAGYTWRTPAHWPHWPALAALWILAMFWPSPMARHYYLAWGFPALAVIWHRLRAETGPDRRPILAPLALVGWAVGVLCLGWETVRWYGLHLAVLALLMAALVRGLPPRPKPTDA